MDFGSWMQSWIAVTTKPGEETFVVERTKPHATLQTALIWIAGAALISGLFSWIGGRIALAQFNSMGGMDGILSQLSVPPEVLDQIDQIPFFGGGGGTLLGALAAMVFSVLFFLIFVGVLHLVARLFGGTGSFGMYAYLLSTFWVPLSIVTALFGIIPLVGGCLGFIVSIYQIILAYYATRVEQNLTQGKAIIVILTPLLLLLCIFGCIIGGAVSALGVLSGLGQ